MENKRTPDPRFAHLKMPKKEVLPSGRGPVPYLPRTPGPKAKPIVELDKEYSSTSYIKMYPLAVSHGRGATYRAGARGR